MFRSHSRLSSSRCPDRRRYKGGSGGRRRGGGNSAPVLQAPAPKAPKAAPRQPTTPIIFQFPEFEVPKLPHFELPEPPPPPPPATEYRDEVEQAGREERRKARRRRGMLAALFAGETGGFKGAAQTGHTQAAPTTRDTLG